MSFYKFCASWQGCKLPPQHMHTIFPNFVHHQCTYSKRLFYISSTKLCDPTNNFAGIMQKRCELKILIKLYVHYNIYFMPSWFIIYLHIGICNGFNLCSLQENQLDLHHPL